MERLPPSNAGDDEMTDRKLLQLAAKAAEVNLHYADDKGLLPYDGNTGADWNPLTDDGDALRLAVKLSIVVWECDQYDKAMVEVRYGETRGEYWELVGKNRYAATRRAITRAAAEIGKAMP
jgi:hypothetical protein